MIKNDINESLAYRLLPWLAATAFFMQALDTSILNTALPAMAKSLNKSPLNMQSAIVSYALTLALFIPINGYLVDRFGTRNIFVIAISFFSVGSLCCALSTSLFWLDVSRILQGIGGSMMVPVSRLTLIKYFERHEFLAALNTSLTFGLIGLLIGPVLGGYLVQALSWHWIFLINLPVGIIGIIAGIKFMPNLFGSRAPFDFIGAFLISVAMVSLTLTFELINEGISPGIPIFLSFLAILALLIYRFYARYAKFAIFPLTLFELHTFRIGLMGNLISRLGISAMPFLVILLLQVVFGYSPIMAGLIFVPMAMASVIMKKLAQPILKKFGYRHVLLYNTFIVGIIIISLSFLNPLSPIIIIIIQLFILGFVSSLQFTSMNSIALADLEDGLISSGNSLVTISQQLAISFGIAFAAVLLRMFSDTMGQVSHNIDYAFKITFIIFGLITCLSSLIFNRLHPEDGYNLITKIKKIDKSRGQDAI